MLGIIKVYPSTWKMRWIWKGACVHFVLLRKMKAMTPPMTLYIPSLPRPWHDTSHLCHTHAMSCMNHASLNLQYYLLVRGPIYLAWILAQDGLGFVATGLVYCVLSPCISYELDPHQYPYHLRKSLEYQLPARSLNQRCAKNVSVSVTKYD